MPFQGRDEVQFSDGSAAQRVAIVDADGNHLPGLGGAISVKRAAISASSGGDNELVVAVSEKKIKVLAVFLVAKEAVDITFYSDNQSGGTALTGTISLTDNEGFVLPGPTNPGMHWMETAAGKKLNLYLSAAKQVSGCLLYYEGV